MIAKLTSKGQLTIPKAVREELSLHTGSHVSFVVIGGRAELTPISTPLHTLKTVLPVFTFDKAAETLQNRS